MHRLAVCFFLVIFFYSNGRSQFYETIVSKITDQSGNSPSATFSIAEDNTGFIWFGTVDGLYRYDGHNFHIFRNNPKDSMSLSNNTIRDIMFDSRGYLWIATQGGGINKFDPQTERFERYLSTSFDTGKRIRGNSVWSLYIDKQDNIYAGITGFGIDKIENLTGEIINYNIDSQEHPIGPQDGIRATYIDGNNNIWSNYGDKGVTRLNTKTLEIDHFMEGSPLSNQFSGNLVFNIHEDMQGNIWVASYGGGLNKINPRTLEIKNYRHSPSDQNSIVSDLVYHISQSKLGELWIATENGISHLNTENEIFDNYINDLCDLNSLRDNRARCIFIDSNDIIWIGNESGVDKLLNLNRFKVYKNIPGNKNSLSEGIVRGILKDQDDNIWIGLIQNGLYKYNPFTNKYTAYYSDKSNKNGLTGNQINLIFQDSGKTKWVGEWDNGIFRYDNKADHFTHFASTTHQKLKLSDNRIQVLIEEPHGILWVGTENGINRIDVAKSEIHYYFQNPENTNSLSGNSIQSNAFKFDDEGNLWVGTWENGLNKIEFINEDYKKPKFTHWRNDPDKKNTLNNNNVIALHIDHFNNIWIGTFGGGLNKYNANKNEFTHYTTEDGLPNNIIFSILEDQRGYLWMSTDNGISCFDPTSESFVNYDKSDGLQGNHFFWGASHKSFDNEFFFGGINGLNSFYPEKIKTDSIFPPGVLVNLLINNIPLKTEKSLTELKEIELKHDQNFLTFEIAALNYKNPIENLYRCQLEGLEKNWNDKGNARIANYTDLKPGTYTFKYKVSNSDGFYNTAFNSLKIIIKPPWYGSWIAKIGFALVLLSSLFAFYRIRIGMLQKQKKRLEEQVENRTVEIASQNIKLEAQKEELSRRNDELNATFQELAKTQKALIDSEKIASLGILTAGVAHEINNPLNFISVSIENIKYELTELFNLDSGVKPEKINELHTLIEHSETGIERISSIIGSLQALIKHNKEPLETCSPSELINSSVLMLESKIPDFINISYDLQETAEIKCKRHQISQVLINIIQNGVDAILEKNKKVKEEINISLKPFRKDGVNGVIFSISNTGPKIPDDVIKNLFDPFFTTKAPNKGTGLGLYITYNIINDHSGTINVKNENNKVVFDIFVPSN